MARRHLGYSIDQWEWELPWWQQQVYAEGLQIEFGAGQEEPEYLEDEPLDIARGLGLTVQNIG